MIRHVISALSATWSVHDQAYYQCMISHVISVWSALWLVHDQHVISACAVSWSVYDQLRDHCMVSHVISAWSGTWRVPPVKPYGPGVSFSGSLLLLIQLNKHSNTQIFHFTLCWFLVELWFSSNKPIPSLLAQNCSKCSLNYLYMSRNDVLLLLKMVTCTLSF